MDDVALFAIGVMQERNVRAAIGVVFDGRHLRGHADFVAPEVHLAVLLLVATAAMPDHDFAVIVAAARAFFRLQQSLLRLLLGDVALVQDGDEPSRRRIWIKAFQSHRCLLPLTSSPFREKRNGRIRCKSIYLYRFSAYSIIFSPSASFT